MPDFIDLGISYEPKYTEERYEDEMGKKTYPCTYITSDKPIEFGDAGTAEIRYKLIEKTEKNRDGKEEYRYELELHGIMPMESGDMEEDDEEEDEEKPMKRKAKKGFGQNFGEMLDKARMARDGDE